MNSYHFFQITPFEPLKKTKKKQNKSNNVVVHLGPLVANEDLDLEKYPKTADDHCSF